eukprot:5401687-Alexandrium_andersonii.AAC.1
MSASLVGSEMCIRDSPKGALARLRRGRRARGVSPGSGRTRYACRAEPESLRHACGGSALGSP